MKKEFERANSYPELFKLVKEMVKEQLGLHRVGLMLGLSDLGIQGNQVLGAFHPMGSNIIVINTTPLKRIEKELFKPYLTTVLLHEYLHSLGFEDEEEVQALTYVILEKSLGENHIATKVARKFNSVFHGLTPEPSQDKSIKLVEEFDSSNTSYIG